MELKKGISKLDSFVRDPKNSTTRELMLNNKLLFDLKSAAANNGYDLQVYSPEVDRHGFDIILSDNENYKQLQLKSVVGGKADWHVHKRLLRPSAFVAEDLGFEFSPTGVGSGGGIILIEIKIEDSILKSQYYYTDIYIIKAIELKLIDSRRRVKSKTIETLLREIKIGVGTEKVKLMKSLFIKANDPEILLLLLNLPTRFVGSWDWTSHIIHLSNSSDKKSESFKQEKAEMIAFFDNILS